MVQGFYTFFACLPDGLKGFYLGQGSLHLIPMLDVIAIGEEDDIIQDTRNVLSCARRSEISTT